MNLVFDIETDNLLDDVTKIHCLVIHDLTTHQTSVFNDQGSGEAIVRGIQMLEVADCLIGHNSICFDLAVIAKLFPWFNKPSCCLDTLVLSNLYHPNLLDIDKKRVLPNMPLSMYGRHSLKAWGYRLNVYKGQFGEETDWKKWSQEMEDYCIQDVKVTIKLWQHFATKFQTG